MSTTVALIGATSTDEVAESASSIWRSTLDALPRVGIALAVVVVAWGIGRLGRAVLTTTLRRRHTPSFSVVMAKLAGWGITTVGALLALAVTFPSIQPVDVLAGLGFFSVAIGFAFQDILENLLAGILLLFRQPFVGGDQIQVGEHEGTVERITIRETVLTTYSGEQVLIPNADVYKNAIRIQTAHPIRRTNFVVGVSYGADLDRARDLAVAALRDLEGIVADPPPEVLIVELAASAVSLDVRYWSSSVQQESRTTRNRAIAVVKRAFDDAGIEIPNTIVELKPVSTSGTRS